jgi:hypothetical protein
VKEETMTTPVAIRCACGVLLKVRKGRKAENELRRHRQKSARCKTWFHYHGVPEMKKLVLL